MSPLKKIVILISGNGSNAQAIIEACNNKQIHGEVVAVISNKANAYGLTRAESFSIPAITLAHSAFDSRESFDNALAEVIDSYQPDLIVLAGFMRILTPGFVSHYLGKMLNIHPSLLPKYPGLHTHQRAIDAGDSTHGSSVHFVTEELDGGPIILKSVVPVRETDTAESLAKRVAEREWLIFPLVISWFCENKLIYCKNNVILSKKQIPRHGLIYEDL